ncbi:hypothetical protein HAX54_034492 [Datura stramonium]|uniref:Secreted protein n=1 Tax=Datura stramonium TaxID=4076 RepID=A0ABS8VE05_DATST|nr:hypothetical protein [Datura stramonium]
MIDVLGFRVYRNFLCPCNVGIGSRAWNLMLSILGWCLACASKAFVHTTREWCSACAVRLDPYLSSDVLTRMPSLSWDKRKLGLLEVDFRCCLPNSQELSCTIGFLLPLARRVWAKPKAALVSHVFLASSWSMSSSSDPLIRPTAPSWNGQGRHAAGMGMRPTSLACGQHGHAPSGPRTRLTSYKCNLRRA